MIRYSHSIVILLALAMGACASKNAGSTEPELARVREVGLANAVVPMPGIVSSGQPTEAQLQKLADLGYRTFVNLRADGEEGSGWEEAVAKKLGVAYSRIPVAGADGVTVDNAKRLATALAHTPAVVYCRTGNRVGALLALKARFVDGKSVDEALAIGKAGGLTKLEPKVRELLDQPK